LLLQLNDLAASFVNTAMQPVVMADQPRGPLSLCHASWQADASKEVAIMGRLEQNDCTLIGRSL
jgi:hypothetical protein